MRRRTLGIVIAGAVLIVAVIMYGTTILNQVRGIESHWQTFSTLTVKRDEQIHRIQQELGYGGFIHSFKNFVLRNDLSSMDKAIENLVQVRDAIAILRSEGLSEEEAAALDSISSTVRAYEVRITMVDDAFAEGMSSNEADSLVIVDNSAALAALKSLAEASALRLKQVQDATEQQLSSTIQFASLGLLAVPMILLFGFASYRSMRSQSKAHAATRAASRRMEGLLDTSPEALIVADEEGIIVRANQAATYMLDYEPGELTGKPLSILIPAAIQEAHHKKFESFAKSPKHGVISIAGELHTVTKKGREIPIEINLGTMEQGSELLITAVIHDITLRLAYENALMDAREKAVQASDAKSEFLANMSHEIRTPINAVIGLSCLALKTKLDAKQRDYTDKIYSSGQQLLGVVNDILDFSKIEAGELDIIHSRFQLSSIIRDVTAMIAARAAEKGLELIFRVSPDAPDSLIGDSQHLGQVLTNLVANAVKFTDTGTIVVEGQAETTNDNGINLQFSVTDTGIGIEKERVSGLFDAFTQADTSSTRRHGGTGLGLAICKNIIDAMGGEISVSSQPGKGSTFSFTVPLRLDPDADDRNTSLVPVDPENTRILIVDDNEMACQIMEDELTGLGFVVDTVMSGTEALQALEQAFGSGNPYDLMLLDWRMPGMDGLQTARAIEDNPKISAVPMIFIVTAFSSDDAKRLAGDLPINAFLDKPLNTSVLIDTLVNVLTNRVDKTPGMTEIGSDAVMLVEAAKGKRVMVVEDNSLNQQVAREILENEGLLIDTADNGRIALDLLFKQGPDFYSAILMDVQMPEMDGVKATREIRKDPSFNDLPIIALTAHAMSDDRQRCLDAGMNAHLTKPVIADDLIAVINTWIAGAEPPPERPKKTITTDDVFDAVSEGMDVLALPVLNLEKASSISRLSKDFLEELLCDFKDHYESAAETIRDHLDSGDRPEAQILAHTVKGISGSLGADQVYAAATALDAGLKNDAPDQEVDQLYGDFAVSLGALLNYIDQNVVKSDAKPEPS